MLQARGEALAGRCRRRGTKPARSCAPALPGGRGYRTGKQARIISHRADAVKSVNDPDLARTRCEKCPRKFEQGARLRAGNRCTLPSWNSFGSIFLEAAWKAADARPQPLFGG